MHARFLRPRDRRAYLGGLLALALSAALHAASPIPAAGDDDGASWMFDPRVVVPIDLALTPDAIAALAAEPREYVPATFTMAYGDRRYGPWNVALKLKGQVMGSFRPLSGKAAFKLKFPAGARPDGLEKMTLDNMVQDQSKVHEAVSYALFRAMDVAAPRTGYASVTVNGAPYGIYVNVETMDDVALARWYPATRHLYEGSYGFRTNPADPFDAHYEVDEGDDDDRRDLAELLATAGDVSPGWYARIAAVADVEQLTRMWATEAYVGHWDGYTGALVNNYYLHADGDGRFTMLPWGTDQTLGVRTPLYDGSAPHALFDGCVGDPICGALYGDALAAVARVARRVRPAALAVAIERRIRPAIARDPKLEHPASDARRALSATIGFLRGRRTDFAVFLAARPRAPRGLDARASLDAIALRWKAPTGRARSTTTGHAVEYRRSGAPWARVELPAAATTYTIAGLAAGTYEVRVRRLAGGAASIGGAPAFVVVAP